MKKNLVTGATGKLGTIVVNKLLETVNAEDISIMVRDAQIVEDWKKKGVQVLIGDYSDTSSLLQAFEDTEKLYFISSSDKEDRFRQHQNVVDAALRSGVGHLFYTSAHRGWDSHDSLLTSDGHWQTDAYIKDSGVTYTILKHSLYTELLPIFMGSEVAETGTIYIPAGSGRSSYATREDLAAAGVNALTSQGHENKTYNLSDDRSFSFQDVAEIMSELSGKFIRYIDPEEQLYIDKLIKAGVSDKFLSGVLHFCHALKEGEFDFPSHDLEFLLGRKPESLNSFLKKTYLF